MAKKTLLVVGLGNPGEKYAHTRPNAGFEVLARLEKDNYDCILWENGCSLYEHRPSQCRTYPFWAWIVKDKETWDDVATECPGMRAADGRLWTYEEIEKNRQEYIANQPLTREEVLALIAQE